MDSTPDLLHGRTRVETTIAITDPQPPSWFQAMTATERLRACGTTPTTQDQDRGLRHLHRWKAATYHRPEAFASWSQSLGMQGDDEWVRLLSQPPRTMGDAFTEPAPWTRSVTEALAATDDDPAALSHRVQMELLAPVAPLISAAQKRLREAITATAQRHGRSDLAHHLGGILVRTWPQASLSRIALRVAVLRMHVDKLQGRLTGSTAEERFRAFVTSLASHATTTEILTAYPTMTRHCQRVLDDWVTARAEFVGHLLTDEADLRTLVPDADVADLARVTFELGDGHRGGRSVGMVEFVSGSTVVYKPRPLDAEARYQELLTWAARKGMQPELPTLQVLTRGDHGWMEFIPTGPVMDQAGYARFYRRQGGHLALLHALNCRDLHRENIVASGERPFIVDLEALFHAEPAAHPDARSETSAANRIVAATVLATGLLPNPRTGSAGAEGTPGDLSGLVGAAQLSSAEVITWDGPGTDDMRLTRRRVEIPIGANVPWRDGRASDVTGFADELEAGFREVYELLVKHRAELLSEHGPIWRFADVTTRVIVRNTQLYSDLLDQSFHPDLLGNALDRDHFIHSTLPNRGTMAVERELIASEWRQLDDGDIPLFQTQPQSTRLTGADGTRIEGALAHSGLSLALDRIAQLGPADLNRQLAVLRSSLAVASVQRAPLRWPVHLIKMPAHVAPKTDLVRVAAEIGDALLDQAIHVDGNTGWIGVLAAGADAWQLGAIGTDLYAGRSGIAVFLTTLGAYTGERRFREAARRTVTELAYSLSSFGDLAADQGNLLGMAGAIDGMLYAIALQAAADGDAGLAADALRTAAPILRRAISGDDSHDLIGGSAGTILTLAALAALCSDPELLNLVRLGADRLVAAARPDVGAMAWPAAQFDGATLTGLSHGAAGIALALARAAELTEDPRYRETATAALRFEHARYRAELPGWMDLRPGAENMSMASSWCHGAPGIGLARLALPSGFYGMEVEQDLQRALNATLRHYERNTQNSKVRLGNLSLCHGETASVAFLSLAAHRTADTVLARRASLLSHALVVQADQYGWSCGMPNGLFNPGLLTGLAGIGYGMLACAAPDELPNVLTLGEPAGRR